MMKMRSDIVKAALTSGRSLLLEPEAKSLCRQYSIPVPEFAVAKTQDEAYEISLKLGFPLVGKIVSHQVIHKTDSGGVILGIRSADEARGAFETIASRVRRSNPESEIEGILLERMEPPGVEVIVGAKHDPQFGKVLVFGAGGVFVDVFRDVSFKLAPISEREARSMLNEIRSQRLLKGYRGSPPADEDALVKMLLSVSNLVLENEEIAELDLNPVISSGRSTTAVDARVILNGSEKAERPGRYPPSSLLGFFKAQSVAVIGASSTPGKIGYEVLRNLSEYEYKGQVYPINPSSESILGLKAYPSVLQAPGDVELAVFTVASKLAPSIMDECGRKGVRNAVIISGGFKETGFDAIEQQTVEVAKKYGIRIVGPNCIGVLDGHSRLDTFFQPHERTLRPKSGSVAFITQSGTFGNTFLEWAAENDLGISKFVSYGNRCDVDEADLIEFFGQDKETSIIAMYIEGVADGRALYEKARRTTLTKPIVAVKAGKTSLGSTVAKSHTGWLAGSYEVTCAALRQAGVIVAEDIVGLFDATRALAMQPLPKGSNIVMITNGAGPCVMTADKIAEYEMSISPLSDEVVSELRRELPSYCYVGETTVDLTGSATSKDYETALSILARTPTVHILAPFFVFQDAPLDEGIVQVIQRINTHGKTMLCCASGGPYTREMSRRVEQTGVPVYETPERIGWVIYALAQYSARKAP